MTDDVEPERIHQPRTPVTLRVAWRMHDPAIERDAELFWRKEGLLDPTMSVADRLGELCVAGYDGDELIALSTARIRPIDFLGVKLAMVRIATASHKRQNRLGTFMITSAREHLERWSLLNPAEEVMGMGTVIQSTAYETRGPSRAVLRDARLAFIGWTANGNQMRVAWFEHGRIPRREPGSWPQPGSSKFE